MQLSEDPVQLLTRLATVLCKQNEEDDLSSPDESSSTEDYQHDKKDAIIDSTIQRIRRSLRISECESVEPETKLKFSSPPYSPKSIRSFGRVTGQRFARNRRASEAHTATNFYHRGSIKSHHRLMFEVETKCENPRTFKRSVSERKSNSTEDVHLSEKIVSGPPLSQVKKDVLTGEHYTTENTSQPIASIAEFCHLLDRVQVSRQNSAAP